MLHVFLEVDELVGQDVGLGDEAEVLRAVDLPQLRDLPVHEILSRHVKGAREVIDFLIFVQRLVNRFFYGPNCPAKCPSSIIVLVGVAMVDFDVAEAVVLKCVAHNFDIAVVQIEVVASVKGHVGPDSDGVFVRSENEEVPLDLPA